MQSMVMRCIRCGGKNQINVPGKRSSPFGDCGKLPLLSWLLKGQEGISCGLHMCSNALCLFE